MISEIQQIEANKEEECELSARKGQPSSKTKSIAVRLARTTTLIRSVVAVQQTKQIGGIR
jgi:hypothetical protein